MFDVVIIGAGPAGSVAALLLAKKRLSVALIERTDPARPSSHTTWLSAPAQAAIKQLHIPLRRVVGPRVQKLTFFSPDLTRQTTCRLARSELFLVDRAILVQHLVRAATAAGASLIAPDVAEALDLGEDHVAARLASGRAIQGRIAIVADGSGSLLARCLQRPRGARLLRCCQLELHVGARLLSDFFGPSGRMLVGLNHPQPDGLAYIFSAAPRLVIGLASSADALGAARQLKSFCQRATEANLLPANLPLQFDSSSSWVSPPGAALDWESPIAKRAVLIGRAGGFVAPISHQTIYPAVRSAQLAAGAVVRALQATNAQDELGRFDALWRTDMAGYLSLPNTNLQLLLPLAFSNPNMARRLARTFLTGQTL
jgi:flavin-dependent dehydrogenase